MATTNYTRDITPNKEATFEPASTPAPPTSPTSPAYAARHALVSRCLILSRRRRLCCDPGHPPPDAYESFVNTAHHQKLRDFIIYAIHMRLQTLPGNLLTLTRPSRGPWSVVRRRLHCSAHLDTLPLASMCPAFASESFSSPFKFGQPFHQEKKKKRKETGEKK